MSEGKKGKAFKRMKTNYPGVFYIEGDFTGHREAGEDFSISAIARPGR